MRITPVVGVLLALGLTAAPTQAQASHTYPAAAVLPAGVHADYDPQFDKTVLQLDPARLDSTLAVSALVAVPGHVVRADADGVVLAFWSTAAGHPLADARRVTLAIDGAAAVDLGDAWLTPQPRPGFTEVAMKAVPLDVWLALASARSARLRVGAREFALSDALLASIRAFAGRMAPGAGATE